MLSTNLAVCQKHTIPTVFRASAHARSLTTQTPCRLARLNERRHSAGAAASVAAQRPILSLTGIRHYASGSEAGADKGAAKGVPPLVTEDSTVADPVAQLQQHKYIYGYDDNVLANADETVRRLYSMKNASKQELNKVALHENMAKLQSSPIDTGSTAVQVAALTTRILYMLTHMKEHPKDLHSRRGLELMVQKRRKLLKYLRRQNLPLYVQTLKEMNLRPFVTVRNSKNK